MAVLNNNFHSVVLNGQWLFRCLYAMLVTLVCLYQPSVFAETVSSESVTTSIEARPFITEAAELELAQHETWLALLHYKQETVMRRFVSQADDSSFFLSEHGKTDAEAELNANIAAFVRGPHSGHAQCLFPARWWWLKQQLPTLQRYHVSCPQLEAYMTRIGHDRLHLVFPTMYLNNPGSTFGHTFLRFDKDGGSILLSRTLNYAASVDKEDDIVRYVSKGLFGGYKGIFRMKRYYQTVQEYSNIENRDIWEYSLDFTAEEIEQLVRHVWETRGIDFDYYFFRENCAYRLLAMLDVIRPGMALTTNGNFSAYAIPVDTVRALAENGLIKTRALRPSLATQIDGYFDSADKLKSDVVVELVALESDTKAADFGTAIDTLLDRLPAENSKRDALRQSYNILQFYGEDNSPKAQTFLQLINTRSQTAPSLVASQAVETKHSSNESDSPELGHKSIRLAVGYGQQNSQPYVDLRFRPAFHDLLDAPTGYIDGAEINVFDTRLKWLEDDGLRLESLRFFNVTSLSPISPWQKPVSWLLDIRLDRTQLSATQSVRNLITRGGAGLSYRHRGWTGFAFGVGELNASSSYSKGYSLLFGLQLGFNYHFNRNQFTAHYEIDDAVSGFKMDRKVTELGWQFNLKVNHAVRMTYRLIDYDFYHDKDWADEDWVVDYNYYF